MDPSADDSSGVDTMDLTARQDLGVVRYDDDLVLFDPLDRRTHVLGGGARLVWEALTIGPARDVVGIISRSVDEPRESLEPEVTEVVERLHRLGLLRPFQSSSTAT